MGESSHCGSCITKNTAIISTCQVLGSVVLILVGSLHGKSGTVLGQIEEQRIAGVFSRLTSAPAIGARMAEEDIYRLTGNPGKVFTLDSIDSRCNAGPLVYKLMSEGIPKPVIIAGCQQDCELIAHASPIFNALTICYGAVESQNYEATQRNYFPSLFLTRPSQFPGIFPSLANFISHFGWTNVAILYEDHANYIDVADQLAFFLENHGKHELQEVFKVDFNEVSNPVELITSSTTTHPSYTEGDRGGAGGGPRVILSLLGESSSRELLCQIYQYKSLLPPQEKLKNTWIFLGLDRKDWTFLRKTVNGGESESSLSGNLNDDDQESSEYEDDSYEHGDDEPNDDGTMQHSLDSHCSVEQLNAAAEGAFIFQPLLWNSNEEAVTVSQTTVRDFRRRLIKELEISGEHVQEDYDLAPLAYDSVWAAYLALNATQLSDCSAHPLEQPDDSDNPWSCQFSYDNQRFGQNLRTSLQKIWFIGLSGEVSFNKHGHRSIRDVVVGIQQFRNGSWDSVGRNFNFNNTLKLLKQDQELFGNDFLKPTSNLASSPKPPTGSLVTALPTSSSEPFLEKSDTKNESLMNVTNGNIEFITTPSPTISTTTPTTTTTTTLRTTSTEKSILSSGIPPSCKCSSVPSNKCHPVQLLLILFLKLGLYLLCC